MSNEFGKKFLDAYRAQGASPADLASAESEIASIRTPTSAPAPRAANPYDQFDEQVTAQANPYDQFDNEKPKTSFWEDVKIAGAQALNSIDTGIDFMNQGLVGMFTDDEQKDRVFRNLEARQKAREQAANPEQKEQTFGGKLGGAMATLPLQAAAAVTSGPQRMKEMLDQGASPGAAWRSGMIDQVTNTAAAMLPGSLGVGAAAKVGSGAALSAGAGGLTDAYSNIEGGSYDPWDLEARALDAIPGAAFGGMHAMGDRGAQRRAVQERDAIKDSKEIVGNLKLQEDRLPSIDTTGLPRYELRGMGEQPLPQVDFNSIIREGEAPRLPDQNGETPLPTIKAIADQQILLPDQPQPVQETNARPETSLPVIDPRLAGAEQTADLLSLADESQYPKSQPSTPYDITTGGRVPDWALADLNKNYDFPLRQEFLDQPEIRQAVENFQREHQGLQESLDSLAQKIEKETKWHQDYEGAKTDADFDRLNALLNKHDQLEQSRRSLEQEFQAGMEAMGIRNPAEAHGLRRPLYETKNQGIGVRKTHDARPVEDRRVNNEQRERFNKMSKEEIFQELYTDKLTSLGNRRAFDEAQGDFVASIDADGLKVINDTKGHEAGDKLLKTIAGALKKEFGTAYRFGGDEFAVKGMDEQKIRQGLENVRKELAKKGVGFSYGVAKGFKEADAQMYSDKRKRKGASNSNQAIFESNKENVRKLGWAKKQGGGIAREIFSEGFKPLTRALSRLTDKAWLKERFPGDKFMMNADGTPLVLLHGSDGNFLDFDRGTEGVHAGFTVPSHMRITRGPVMDPSVFMRPKANAPKGLEARGKMKEGANIRPVVIRKGNYPFIPRDFSNWSPELLIMNPDFRGQVSTHATRIMEPQRQRWYRDAIMAAGGDGDKHRGARLMSEFLKEQGIDGFFYRNHYETLGRVADWTKKPGMDEYSLNNEVIDQQGRTRVPVQGLKNPVSFVTFDPANVVSVFNPESEKPIKYKINPLGHKQGGGLNPDLLGLGAAADAIAALATRWTTPMAKGENQMNAFKKTPIGRNLEEGLFSKDVSVEDAIKQTVEHGKDADKGTALIGGGAMRAEIKQHPILFATYQWMNNAAKKADYLVREFVRPAEESINTVLNNKKHSKIIHEIFMEELRTDKRYGEQALRDAGAPPEVVKGYTQFRDMMDKAYEAQNQALEAQGKPRLSRRQAYIASRWSGNWKAPVYVYQRGEDGQIKRDQYGQPVSKLAFYIADTTRWGAKGALRHMKAIMQDVDEKKSTVSFRSGRNQDRGFVDLGYHDMLKMLDSKDPRVAELQSVYEEYIQSLGEVDKNQIKHHLTKSGVRGFEGDRPWVKHNKGTHADIRDMFKQQFQYAKNAFHWSQMQDAVSRSSRLFKDPAVNEANPNAIAMAKEYAKNQLGYGEMSAITDLENRIAKISGMSRSTLSNIVGVPRTIFYWTKLGFFNIPYTAVSLTQPLFSMPWHRKLTLEGYEHKPMDTYARAIMDISALVNEDYSEFVENAKTPEYTKIGAEAIQFAKDNGIIDINAMSDVADVGRKPWVREFENIITKNMTYAERVSRGLTFLSFVHHLDQSGKFEDKLDMFQKAEDLTNLVMTDYRVQERAPLFSRGGLTGSALSTLNTFKVNQWNQLYKLSKDAVQKKQVTPLMMLIGTQLTLGGAMGFYGIDTLDKLWEYFKEEAHDSWYPHIKDWSIKETLADMPDLFAYGGVSKLTGVNLSSRYDAGTIVDPSLEGLFPFLGDLLEQGNRLWSATGATLTGSPDAQQERQMAARAVLPSSMKGLYETTMANQLESEDGGVGTIRRPNDRRYTRDTGDRVAKAVGTTSLDETKAKNQLYFGEQDTKRRQERMTSVSKKFAEAVTNLDADGMLEMAYLYNQIAEDPAAHVRLFKSIPKTQRNYLVNKLDRAYMDAKTKAGLRRLLDYVE